MSYGPGIERAADIVARRARGEKLKDIGQAWKLSPKSVWAIWRRATTPRDPRDPQRIKEFIDVNCQVPGLFHLMCERGIYGRAMAEAMGLDESAVSCWRSGKSSPPIPMLKRLAEHLDVSLDVLVYWRGDGS